MADYKEAQENTTGASCSGSSGDSNRVLTLSNTGLTKQPGFLVYASGLALALTTEYTVSHLSSSTMVTFLNPLWDDMTIVVSYFQGFTTITEYEKKREDIQAILVENGQTLTLTRQVETVDTMGGVTTISETTYNIITMIQDITKKDRQIHEMGLAIPGNSKAFFYHEYPNSITGNGLLVVEVGDIITDSDSNNWRIEQILAERYADSNEIFKVGVIKKIDLD